MDCIFCEIIEGTIPSKKVFENKLVYAFYDIQPAALIHVLIIPKKHIPTMNDVGEDDLHYITAIHQAAQIIAKELNVDQTGYRLVNNCNAEGGQVVYHLHYHLLAGEKLKPLNT